jgi:putative SOS response-associated peptidase YedK
MCGRYALGIRASFVRHQLQQQGMQVDDAPDDDEARETHNFPPGAYGLVYRADVPDQGFPNDDESSTDATDADHPPETSQEPKSYTYQIKVMKWGLIPFWTKRSPDYGSMMRTINCRDDSLFEDRGMWTNMKRKKRCLVVAQGFYEWLKKGPGGKEKIPHFVKRKDGQLMCFAGLWDCVKYEDSDEKLYTYTIITTDSNKQLSFLHDRMPVILDAGTDAVKIWLDPTRNKWSKELQSLLKPFAGELECYPVDKDVGKVGNNSPAFIVPVDSKENKKNIANFFGNAQKMKGTRLSNRRSRRTMLPCLYHQAKKRRDTSENTKMMARMLLQSSRSSTSVQRSRSRRSRPRPVSNHAVLRATKPWQ